MQQPTLGSALKRRAAFLAILALAASAAVTVAEARAGRTAPSDCDSKDDDEACQASGKPGGKSGK